MTASDEIKEGDIVTLKKWFVQDAEGKRQYLKGRVERITPSGKYLIDVGYGSQLEMSADEITTDMEWKDIHE